MEKKVYQKQLPVGDVSEQKTYQDIVNGYITSTFNKAKCDALKKKETNIKIRSIYNIPKSYIVSDMFYEQRAIASEHTASGYVEAPATKVHSASEYNMWEVECPPPVKMFAKGSNHVRIKETMYLTDCNTCYTSGQVPCSCGNGQEYCPSCNGHGAFTCGRCNGYGQHQCTNCTGLGYVVREEIVGYEGNYPIYEKIRYTCDVCYGKCNVTCANCNGYGKLTCNTCLGTGLVTCHICNGTARVTCSYCSGFGHFLDCVAVSQVYDTKSITGVISDAPIDTALYGEQTFRLFDPHSNDYLIYEIVSDEPITTVETNEVLSNTFKTPWDLQKEMDSFASDIARSNKTRRKHKYRIRVYQRDILQVEYDFDGHIYYMLIDASTGEILMDKNPYEHVATAMLQDIQEHVKTGKYKTFLKEYDEFVSITGFNNVAYNEDNIKPLMKKLSLRFTLLPIAIAGIVQALMIVIPYSPEALLTPLAIFAFMLPALLAGFGISRLWKKLSVDNKLLMYVLMCGLPALAAVLVNTISTHFFL